ncbi:ATP synthase F0 subunit B [bacterium]|nr:MAG: ATP synthase F0 subunit B [bacterium]
MNEGEHGKPNLLSPNPGLILWTIIIFVLLLLILRKFAWKPLITALHNREDSIKNTLENAEKQNRESQLILEENRKNLSEANAQAQKIISEGRDMAVKVKDEIVSKANSESKKIIEQAKIEIQQQKESALESLKNEVSDLAIKAAEIIIKANLDSEKQKEIINDFLKDIPKN